MIKKRAFWRDLWHFVQRFLLTVCAIVALGLYAVIAVYTGTWAKPGLLAWITISLFAVLVIATSNYVIHKMWGRPL